MSVIKFGRYPYGKTSSAYKKAKSWLIKNGPRTQNFDYPNYGGLPKSIASKLSSDEVDYIQSIWPFWF